MRHALTKSTLLLTLFGFLPSVHAQSGHGLNAVETAPGTSVPMAPTDPIHPPGQPKPDPAAALSPGMETREELDRDAGGSKAHHKSTKKLSPKQKQKHQDDAILEDKTQ